MFSSCQKFTVNGDNYEDLNKVLSFALRPADTEIEGSMKIRMV